jgi:amino acid adenylation domain-containing protein
MIPRPDSHAATGQRLASLSDAKRAFVQRLLGDRDRPRPGLERIPRRPLETSVPCSPAQRRLWIQEQLTPALPVYNETYLHRVPAPLEIDALQRALDQIVRRHEVLRTCFAVEEGEPVQCVMPPFSVALPVVRLRERASTQREHEVARLIRDHAGTPFALDRLPLLRALIIVGADGDGLLVLTLHHLVFDGWSKGVLAAEIDASYDAIRQGNPNPLPNLPIQYGDHAVWQRRWLTAAILREQRRDWREHLAGVSELELFTDHRRPARPSFRGGLKTFAVPDSTYRELVALAHHHGVTLFVVLMAAFQALLARYSGQDDFAIGVPLVNRTRAELEPLIGFFVNLLPFRCRADGNPLFLELVDRVRDEAAYVLVRQDAAFEQIVEALEVPRHPGRTPLLHIIFQCLDTPRLAAVSPNTGPPVLDSGWAKFDLRLDMCPAPRALEGYLEFSTDLYDSETVDRMIGHFVTLLKSAASDPQTRLAELRLLTPGEETWIVQNAHGPVRDYPRHVEVHALVERRTAEAPDRVAVYASGRAITYDDLNHRANRLARWLRDQGARPGRFVAICLPRSAEQVIAVLAVLKTGAAYVPLDPAHPPQRLGQLLADCGACAVVTDVSGMLRLGPRATATFPLDRDEGYLAALSHTNLGVPVESSSAAYLIYTSGSTGSPLGVVVEHRSLMNLVDWHVSQYQLRPGDRCLLAAAPGFDASVWEIWPTLAAGASLVVVPDDVLALPCRIPQWITSKAIDLAFLPTPIAESLFGAEWPADIRLRALLTGGDRLMTPPSRPLPFPVVNHYGPTENTVVSTSATVVPGAQGPPAIGPPIQNVHAYVLDACAGLAPLGVPGELYLGGASLASGYWNQPEATRECFAETRFGRLFRTKDLVRLRRDGQLEFLGRIDEQVKIRGCRVGPCEVETVLVSHSAVSQSLVVAGRDQSGQKTLIAYVVPTPATRATMLIPRLREHLRDRLPAYMIPSVFVILDRLPLTPNGKIDRRALPEPKQSVAGAASRAARPRSLLEHRIAAVWQQVLGVDRVSIDENFFDLGGHSLLMVRLHGLLKNRLGVACSIMDLLRYPTVRLMSQFVRQQATHGE